MVVGGGGEVYYMSRCGQCVYVYARATLERDIARERGPYWAFARVYAGARDAVRTSRRSMRSGRKLTHPHHPIAPNLGQPSRPERPSRVQRTSVSPLATTRRAAFTAHPTRTRTHTHTHTVTHTALFRHAGLYPPEHSRPPASYKVHPATYHSQPTKGSRAPGGPRNKICRRRRIGLAKKKVVSPILLKRILRYHSRRRQVACGACAFHVGFLALAFSATTWLIYTIPIAVSMYYHRIISVHLRTYSL